MVAMFGVVPVKKRATKITAIFHGTKTLREIRPVFHGLEMTFRKGITVRDIGADMGLGNPQISQQ